MSAPSDPAPYDERPAGPRVVLVTGGTGGIGAAVAVGLAQRGARVVIAGRNADRGAAVLDRLASVGGPRGRLITADLASLADTAHLAAEVASAEPELDALVMCAGVLSTVPEWTDEGLERALALNYLSRHLLVSALLPRLLAARRGRVVVVANAGRYADTLDLDDLHHRRGRRGLRVAARTQFANDVLAVELAARTAGTRLVASCVFPGVVATDVFRNARGPSAPLRGLATWLAARLALEPAAAATTPVALAVDPELGDVSGRFFGPGLRPLEIPERVRDPERRAAIWAAADAETAPYLARIPGRDADRR